jgi:hypothetical protein
MCLPFRPVSQLRHGHLLRSFQAPNMLLPSASLHSAFILPPSTSTFTLPSASSSPLSPVLAASSLSFNALYLRRKHQLAPLQPHRARARPLAFWQRQTEERDVVRACKERQYGMGLSSLFTTCIT